MALTAHLSYSGHCREAFNFYAQLFGGERDDACLWRYANGEGRAG